MHRLAPSSLLFFSLAALLAAPPIALAQQINGEPGSPSATMTIDGKQLPPPPLKFGGVINETAADSKPWWPPRVVPPKGAPNVLLIMTDDQGYAVSSTFGGLIPTPNMDKLAKEGLRYTQFHSTALCSPTRAAIITGRNHHSVGFGEISELATGYPGYDSIIGPENATIGRRLEDRALNSFGMTGVTTTWTFHSWPKIDGCSTMYCPASAILMGSRPSFTTFATSAPSGTVQRWELSACQLARMFPGQ